MATETKRGTKSKKTPRSLKTGKKVVAQGKLQVTRKTDKKGRVTISADFADHLVVIEQINENEVRIRKSRMLPKKYRLAELLAQVKPGQGRGEIDTGPSVGNEAW